MLMHCSMAAENSALSSCNQCASKLRVCPAEQSDIFWVCCQLHTTHALASSDRPVDGQPYSVQGWLREYIGHTLCPMQAHTALWCSYSDDEARSQHSVGAGECCRSASEAHQRLPRAQGALGETDFAHSCPIYSRNQPHAATRLRFLPKPTTSLLLTLGNRSGTHAMAWCL